jgi:hypothetical protein
MSDRSEKIKRYTAGDAPSYRSKELGHSGHARNGPDGIVPGQASERVGTVIQQTFDHIHVSLGKCQIERCRRPRTIFQLQLLVRMIATVQTTFDNGCISA